MLYYPDWKKNFIEWIVAWRTYSCTEQDDIYRVNWFSLDHIVDATHCKFSFLFAKLLTFIKDLYPPQILNICHVYSTSFWKLEDTSLTLWKFCWYQFNVMFNLLLRFVAQCSKLKIAIKSVTALRCQLSLKVITQFYHDDLCIQYSGGIIKNISAKLFLATEAEKRFFVCADKNCSNPLAQSWTWKSIRFTNCKDKSGTCFFLPQ